MKHGLPALLFAACLPSLALAQSADAAPAPSAGGGSSPESGTQSIPQIVLPGVEQLTITGQYRLRYENQYQYDFDDQAGASNDFFGQRIRLDFDFRFDEQFGAFVQLQDVRNFGEETNTVDDSADGLDFHQGFLRVGNTPGIGGTTKIGRQVVAFGAQRLIGGLEWANQGRSFDGIRNTRAACGEGTLDTFALQLRELVNNNDDDDAWLYGGYATFQPGEATVDTYVIGLHDDGVGVGTSHNRITLGVRALQPLGPVDVEVELATQVGEQAGADIPIAETFALHVHGSLDLDEQNSAYLRADFDMASGNDPNSNDNERFNNLFPTGHAHWGMMDFASWSNLVHGSVEAGIALGERTDASVAWHLFRAMEETDAFGGPANQLSAGGAGFSKEMGNEIDLLLDHDLGLEKVKGSIQVGYGLFLPGNGVRDANGSDDLAHFFYAMSNFVF